MYVIPVWRGESVFLELEAFTGEEAPVSSALGQRQNQESRAANPRLGR